MDFTDEAWLKIIFFLYWLQKLFKILKVKRFVKMP